VHLLPLFPVQAEFDAERQEYNRNVRHAFERTRDFQSAHYHLNKYGINGDSNSSFWTRSRAASVSAELTHKIDAFRSRGEAVDYEDEAFTIDDWRSLLIGHGVLPESHDPAADRTDPALLNSELGRYLEFIQQKVEEQRSHTDYLQKVCAPPVLMPRDPRIGQSTPIQQ
jgi:tryptophan halogenase